MRTSFLLALLVLLTSSIPAAEVLYLSFEDQTLGTAPATYVPGVSDTVPGGTAINTSDPTGPGDPDVNPGDFAAPAGVANPNGWGVGSVALQLSGGEGYYVALPSGLSSYTVECLIAFTEYPGGSAEFGLCNVFSTTTTTNEMWELRGMGTFGSPANEFVLMTDPDTAAPGDSNNEMGDFVPSLNTWYHMAVTYDSSTDTMAAIVDGVVVSALFNPGFGADTLNDFTFGYWPSDANSNRDVVGYIDTVRVSDAAFDSILPVELSVFSSE